MSPYAENTEVAPEKTRADIERLVMQAGATAFVSGHANGRAFVAFQLADRRVQFSVPMPTAPPATHYASPPRYGKRSADDRIRQETRAKWRALLFVHQEQTGVGRNKGGNI